jgi:hypothetical protein
VAVFAMSAIALPSASAALPKALIDEATVSGGTASQEAQIAEKQGFEVNVVSDATWGSMTQAEFGTYQVLIAGDPTCSTLPPGLIESASVYGPVVLGLAGGRTSAGNRVIVGTDPVYHDGGSFEAPGARGTIIREGIDYASTKSASTGMYYDASCAGEISQAPQVLEIATALNGGPGSWTIDAEPPCGGNVSLIASNPAFSELTTESLEGWECSVHESFPTFPTEFSALAVATDTTSHPTCGVDPNTGLEACGEAYVLIAGSSIVVKSEQIELTPLEATNPAGTSHTVTAHLTSGGSPLAGQTVTFTVTGQNAGVSGTCAPVSCMTDALGNVTFTYHDENGAGEDTIKASFTDAAGSLQSATAVKYWVAATEEGCSITGGSKADPFTDTKTHHTLYSEDTLYSNLTLPQHLMVRGNGKLFKLTSLTSAQCIKDPTIPPNGNQFNTLSGKGVGTFVTAGHAKPGYTFRIEFKDAGATGPDTIKLHVYNSKGVLEWTAGGVFTTPTQKETDG